MMATLLLAPLSLAAATASPAAICDVHDGDSVRLCSGERVRLVGIDAPELAGSSRCHPPRGGRNPSWCDYAAGIRARDALRAFLRSGPVRITRIGQDRYGRTLARLSVNGRDAGRYLISMGLARGWR